MVDFRFKNYMVGPNRKDHYGDSEEIWKKNAKKLLLKCRPRKN